jgi:CobQ-like glutamine amidotransferase family enzyme
MSLDLRLRVLALYPDRMNIYADRGNLLMLERRCSARDIGFELTSCGEGESFEPDAHDLIYIGGGQDSDQRAIAEDLVATKRVPLETAIADDVVVLAVCGGYQLLGRSYEIGDEQIEGLGLVDIVTVRESGPRLIGNVMIEIQTPNGPRELAGFENHGGRTYLDDACQALGRVVCGFGNNGRDGLEGVRMRNVFGTYLHGPLLPKNHWFADHLTTLALARHDETVVLAALEDEFEEAAHESARRAALDEAARKSRPGARVAHMLTNTRQRLRR